MPDHELERAQTPEVGQRERHDDPVDSTAAIATELSSDGEKRRRHDEQV